MGTELLNRSMDLIHSKVDTVHHLSFDTTYPTKIDGYIFKIFKATQNYKLGDSFALHLDESDILYIANATSFGGQINQSDYFKEGDCVLCVINVTENRNSGSIKLWNISKVYDEKSDAVVFDYLCNGVDDSFKLNEIIKLLQNVEDNGETVTIDQYGINITKEMRKVTRRIIFKFNGNFGLSKQGVWTNKDDTLPDNRSRRMEYIHIESNKTMDLHSSVYREDVFSYVFDFDNCTITQDSKELLVENKNDGQWGSRAFLFGLSGNSKANIIFKNLRYCKDYTGLIFVDGEHKEVLLDNCTLNTNTYGGMIPPKIYGSFSVAYEETPAIHSRIILGDKSEEDGVVNYEDEIADQEYSKEIPFPILIDNYSTTSTVTFKNSFINPNNDGYSAMPHIIHNSGKVAIDGSTINFYNCIRYFDDNLHSTQSAAIFNEPRLVDLNASEYTRFTIPTNVDKGRNAIFGTWNDFIRNGLTNNIEPAHAYRYDYPGTWATIPIPNNMVRPEIEISNSTIKHTKGIFISNLNGIVKAYNSKLEIVNKTKAVDYTEFNDKTGLEKPKYCTARYNRIIDSYGGTVHVKDNTIIANGPNIQVINMGPCMYDGNAITGTLININNECEMTFNFPDLLYPSIFVKLLSINPTDTDDFSLNFSSNNPTTGNKVLLQNNTYTCHHLGTTETFKTDTLYDDAIQSALERLGITNENAKYIAMYAHFKNFVRKNHDTSQWTANDNLLTFDLTNIFGSVLLHNVGDNYITIDNCNTSIIGNDVSDSPIIGIYDLASNMAGKMTITNSNIGSWCSCLTSTIPEKIYSSSTPLNRNSVFAHHTNISNSRFVNFFSYENKSESEDSLMMIPTVYFDTSKFIDISDCYFTGSDVIINTDSHSDVYIDKCTFNQCKLLFNAYKDFTETTYLSNAAIQSRTNNLLACYNIRMTERAYNRRSRQSIDNVTISNCVFNNKVNTKVRFMMHDVAERSGGDEKSLSCNKNTKDCVNRSNIIINSVKNVTIRDSEFNSTGNNILFYGQQSALAEYHANSYSADNINVAPFFNFNLNLSNNTFKSVIDKEDSFNTRSDAANLDYHFIASNVLIYGDTTNLTAKDNNFMMASVDGGCNIMSMTDEMYYKYISEDSGAKYIKNLNDEISKKLFSTIKNKISLYNNEFTSFAFGLKRNDGIAIKKIFSLLHIGSRYSTTDAEAVLGENKPLFMAAFRAFNIGINNCHTILDIQNNEFCKSRGKNSATVVDGIRMIKTYAKPETLLFVDSAASDNDIFSGLGICIETSGESLGADGPHYVVEGTVKDNIFGAKYGTGVADGVDDDNVIRLNMQGLITRNNVECASMERYPIIPLYPSAFDPTYTYYVDSDGVYTETITTNKTSSESNATVSDITLTCQNNICRPDTPDYNYCSTGGYSFIKANKNIYR